MDARITPQRIAICNRVLTGNGLIGMGGIWLGNCACQRAVGRLDG